MPLPDVEASMLSRAASIISRPERSGKLPTVFAHFAMVRVYRVNAGESVEQWIANRSG
jgi:hypothetical protein